MDASLLLGIAVTESAVKLFLDSASHVPNKITLNRIKVKEIYLTILPSGIFS